MGSFSEEEEKLVERLKGEDNEVRKFSDEIFEQCRQKGFTVRQFNILVNSLDIKKQLMRDRAADITRIGAIYPDL